MSLLGNSISGLLAAQRNLTTTGHNISNVNTEGYSRQRVDQGTRPPQPFGEGFIGQGVQVNGIRRVYDAFLGEQLRNTTSEFEQTSAFAGLAERVDNLLADDNTGLTPGIQSFFNSVQDVADDPSSISARQTLLSEAESLVNRFDTIDQRLSDLGNEVNTRVRDTVRQINGISEAIADLNRDIANAKTRGGQPNDLLDQRDQKLQELSELVKVDTIEQDDGALNVFVGNGVPLVIGNDFDALEARRNPYDPSRVEVAVGNQPDPSNISDTVSGGSLGGLLSFREEVLDPATNQLGKIAHGLTESFNAIHQEGFDLRDQFGEEFFSVPDPVATARRGNAGTGDPSAVVASAQDLTGADYRLRYSGGTWQVNRTDTGASVSFTGDGSAGNPLTFDGVEVTVSGAPANGDEFQVRPTAPAAGGLTREINDPRAVAAAAPIIAGPDPDNIGTGSITEGRVVDVNDPDLLNTVDIEFTGPNTYEIGGTPFTYTEGDPITYNGWEVTITGEPQAGDVFTVERNNGASGDNRNANRLADLVGSGVLDNGETSLQDGVGELVADVATRTSQALTNQEAQQSVKNQARESLESVSGVNLDEEAANLLKFQQAYQASAQSIRVADTIFQSLIGAVSG